MDHRSVFGQGEKFYKVKNPTRKFLCALCSSPRQMRYKKTLSIRNYAQLVVIASCLGALLFPLMEFKAIVVVFIVWPCFEIGNKLLYRRELACPYCGFDATWYRRDVRVANKLVKEFWSNKQNLQESIPLGEKKSQPPVSI